jgi:hypothetical protein
MARQRPRWVSVPDTGPKASLHTLVLRSACEPKVGTMAAQSAQLDASFTKRLGVEDGKFVLSFGDELEPASHHLIDGICRRLGVTGVVARALELVGGARGQLGSSGEPGLMDEAAPEVPSARRPGGIELPTAWAWATAQEA